MNRDHFRRIIKVLLAPALFAAWGAEPCPADEYGRFAAELTLAAKAQGMSRLAMDEFSMHGGTMESGAKYAQERLSAELFKTAELELTDVAALEAGSGGQGTSWLAKTPKKNRPQGLIKGAVFKIETGMSVMIKLIDLETGRLVDFREMKTEDRFAEAPKAPAFDMAIAPDMNSFPADFRDALADTKGPGCEASFRKLRSINEAAVDLKARYWAEKMREPGFSYSSLSRNPGSELKDYQTKEKFYALLSKYYEAGEPAAVPEAQRGRLEAFMAKENQVINDCGMN